MKNKSTESIFQKSWFQGIVAFCCVQIAFLTMEWTGWIPKLNDFGNEWSVKLNDVLEINKWATFYSTTFFNIVTVIFGELLIVQICITLIQFIVKRKSA